MNLKTSLISSIVSELDWGTGVPITNPLHGSKLKIDRVPQNPFAYLRKAFTDTTFKSSQYEMIYKLREVKLQNQFYWLIIHQD